MLSTGNDIVSLIADDMQRAIRPVFYKKILSATEIALYRQYQKHIAFENYVWLLWSAKEAAFKYLQRLDPTLIFSPTRVMVHLLRAPSHPIVESFGQSEIVRIGFDNGVSWTGQVKLYAETIHLCSMLYPDVVHSVVNGQENFENVYWGIKTIQDTTTEEQSLAVRKFSLQRLQEIFAGKTKVFKSDPGFPIASGQDTENGIPLSYSHHHQFIAYSFVLK